MKIADDADPTHCRCGGQWYEDMSPVSGLEFGPRPRRLFCRMCGRDRFVRAADLVAR